MKAIILAGGMGTRLRESIGNTIPKPIAPIANKPFLFYLIHWLELQGVKEVILSVGFLKEQIKDSVGGKCGAVSIEYVDEDQPLGTGGAILRVLKEKDIQESIFILNGDSLLDVDLVEMARQHFDSNASLSIALRKVQDLGRYGSVVFDENANITHFDSEEQSDWINGGIYLLDSAHFRKIQWPQKFSFEKDFLSKYVSVWSSKSFLSDGFFIDIGVPEDYKKAQTEIPEFLNTICYELYTH